MSFHHEGKLKGEIKGQDGDIHEVKIEMWASGALELVGSGKKWEYKLISSYTEKQVNNEIYELEERLSELNRMKESFI